MLQSPGVSLQGAQTTVRKKGGPPNHCLAGVTEGHVIYNQNLTSGCLLRWVAKFA